MANPLILPVDPAHLSRLVADLWNGERGAARAHGVDPARITAEAHPSGTLSWFARERLYDSEREAAPRAVAYLATLLEDAGLVVERGSGLRVSGWAAVREPLPLPPPHPATASEWGLTRIVDLDLGDPRAIAYWAALRARREAGARAEGAGPAEDAKRVGARERWLAAYGGKR